MEIDILLNQSLPAIGLELLVLFAVANGLGFRIGRKAGGPDGEEKRERAAGTITGAMLALLGFLLAISLSMADSHFQVRRRQVLDEANAIGTSVLRAQTIGGPRGTEIVRLLRDYARLRLDFFAAGEDARRLDLVNRQTSDLQQRIWDHASAIARAADTPVNALLLSTLNDTFDLAMARRWGLEVRVPSYVISLLLVLSILTMGLMGYYFGVCGVRYPVLSGVLFVAFAVAILLVMDLNRPRAGFIKAEQSALVWLVEDMSQEPPVPAAAP
ncbi:MAG TPA: hypothetical protein VMT70_17000 [Vicinamibacteria bacterium]|nr:hypothetical protein [Vicinamibacteria bacterium]